MAASKKFYAEFLEMNLAMDMDWVVAFASKDNPTAQISVIKNGENKPLDNSVIFLSVEVADADLWHKRAQAQNLEITYPITDESWGVRQFL